MKIVTRSLAESRLELLGALPVDVEEDVAALAEGCLDRRLGRAVPMVEDVGPLGELVRRDHPFELGVVDEMIVHVRLVRPGASAGSWR